MTDQMSEAIAGLERIRREIGETFHNHVWLEGGDDLTPYMTVSQMDDVDEIVSALPGNWKVSCDLMSLEPCDNPPIPLKDMYNAVSDAKKVDLLRDLLRKYIDHVCAEEGTDFLSDQYVERGMALSRDDVDLIKRIAPD